MDDAKTERAVLRSPRDTSYSGYRLRCQRCGPSKLTLAEFREQLSCRPEQIWHCPKCGSFAEFKGSLCAAPSSKWDPIYSIECRRPRSHWPVVRRTPEPYRDPALTLSRRGHGTDRKRGLEGKSGDLAGR